MSKELEALNTIKQARYFIDFELDAKLSEDYKKELDIIETALKALEIIKEKVFNNKNFEWYKHNDDFTWICLDGNADFTKEEAKLLKEVLL